MLKDFIETNNLDSSIMTLVTDTKMDYALTNNLFPKKFAVETKLFITKDNDAFICVIPYNSEIDFSKLKSATGEDEFLEAMNREVFEITGFKKEFVPLLSIYGIKYIIDSSLSNLDLLISRVGEKQFLKAKMSEIIEYNEVEFFDIIK